jgi:hypothetical protein
MGLRTPLPTAGALAMAVGASTTSAFAQSGEFLAPPDGAEGDSGGTEMMQLVPGMSNDTLAFVALMVLFGVGVIAIWARGQIMYAQDEQNAMMLARSAAKQPGRGDGAAAERAAAQAAANRDPSLNEAIANRLRK